MDYRLLIVLPVMTVFVWVQGSNPGDIQLSEDGGYSNILVAISEDVPQNDAVLDRLQEILEDTSEALYTATR